MARKRGHARKHMTEEAILRYYAKTSGISWKSWYREFRWLLHTIDMDILRNGNTLSMDE